MDEWNLRDILLYGTILVKSFLDGEIDIDNFEKLYGNFYYNYMLDGFETDLSRKEILERKRYRDVIDIHKIVSVLESKFFDESFPNAEQYCSRKNPTKRCISPFTKTN